MQWSDCVTGLGGEVINSKYTIVQFNFKLKVSEKCAENVSYVRDDLQACLQ